MTFAVTGTRPWLAAFLLVLLVMVGVGYVGHSDDAAKTAEELLPFRPASYSPIELQIGMPRLIRNGDFDKDGNADLLILTTASDLEGARPWKMQVVLLFGDGAGRFRSPRVLHQVEEVLREREIVWRQLGGIIVGDFDLDGHLDFALTDAVNGDVRVFWGDGAGAFGTTSLEMGDAFAPSSIVSADLNSDGQPDMAVIDPLARSVSVFWGRAEQNRFARVSSFSLPDEHIPLLLDSGDFDGDGTDNLAVLGWKWGEQTEAVCFVAILSPREAEELDLLSMTYVGDPAPVEPPSLAVGDYTRDGHLDILTVRHQHAYVLWGGGGGTFWVDRTYPVFDPRAVQLLLADIDQDGCLNIVLLGMRTQRVWVSTGCYDEPHGMGPIEVSGVPHSAVVTDVNNDGILDLVAATSGWPDWTYLEILLGRGGWAVGHVRIAFGFGLLLAFVSFCTAHGTDQVCEVINASGAQDEFKQHWHTHCIGTQESPGKVWSVEGALLCTALQSIVWPFPMRLSCEGYRGWRGYWWWISVGRVSGAHSYTLQAKAALHLLRQYADAVVASGRGPAPL